MIQQIITMSRDFSLPGARVLTDPVIRVHELQVMMDGALKAYFLPVLSPDDKPCLYGKLADRLFCGSGWVYGYID